MISEEKAIQLLKKYSNDKISFEKVLRHSKAVQKLALEIAEKIADVDIGFIRIGSLLHDIGRFSARSSIEHGIMGAQILEKEGLEEFSNLAKSHLGAGISRQEVIDQKLPIKAIDYLPITKEEKIITHADNLIKGEKRISLQEVIDRYEKEVGKKTAEKIKNLAKEVKKWQSI